MNDKLKEGKPQDIGERAFNFVLDVINLVKELPRDSINDIVIKQLIRSVTSIGANIEEAKGGYTKSDFTHCMNIAKKEARETKYWLKLQLAINSTFMEKVTMLLQENEELIRILTAIVKTSNPRTF